MGEEQIMARLGFSEADTGPMVTKLRAWVEEKCSQGMRSMSGGTWTPGSETLPKEERARQILAFFWASEHYSYAVNCIDGPPWRVVTNVATMKRSLRIDWSRLRPWMADQYRGAIVHFRRLWDEKVLKRTNPYLVSATPSDTHEVG